MPVPTVHWSVHQYYEADTQHRTGCLPVLREARGSSAKKLGNPLNCNAECDQPALSMVMQPDKAELYPEPQTDAQLPLSTCYSSFVAPAPKSKEDPAEDHRHTTVYSRESRQATLAQVLFVILLHLS